MCCLAVEYFGAEITCGVVFVTPVEVSNFSASL